MSAAQQASHVLKKKKQEKRKKKFDPYPYVMINVKWISDLIILAKIMIVKDIF